MVIKISITPFTKLTVLRSQKVFLIYIILGVVEHLLACVPLMVLKIAIDQVITDYLIFPYFTTTKICYTLCLREKT